MKRKIQILIMSLFMVAMITSSFASYQEANTQSQMVHSTLDNCEETNTTITFQKKNIENCSKFEAKNYSKPQSITPSSSVEAVDIVSYENKTLNREVTTLEQNVKFSANYCDECEENPTVKQMSSSKPHSIEKDNFHDNVMGPVVTFVQQCFS